MQLRLDSDRLCIQLEWFEQLWAFNLNNTFTIPLTHILQVSTASPQSNWGEIRAPGTFVPGVIKAGTYYTREGPEFWYVTRDQDYLTLELQEEFFKRIILTLDDAATWATQMTTVLTSPPPEASSKPPQD
ncbi:hypothetical protein [Neosynechococcus sphagnicola]|uniref:hypothetical protein n=1 Tax=Neosynechococcus sphagnicola TaxID=1501145 RepID=UPI00068BC536|nr:hypothetical protein [Neosynechococcus sphagnicola]